MSHNTGGCYIFNENLQTKCFIITKENSTAELYGIRFAADSTKS